MKMMNKYIIAMAVAAGMCAAACSNNGDMPGDEQQAFGTLSTSSLTISVQNEDGIMSRADEEGIDTSAFIVEIKDEAEETVKRCAVKDLPEAIMLPLGSYTITAGSPFEIEKASKAPYYTGSSEKAFEIKENIITEAEPVVCSLAVTKVSVEFSAELKEIIDAGYQIGMALVDEGVEAALTFTADDEEWTGYFDAKEGNTLAAVLSCHVKGEEIIIKNEERVTADNRNKHHIFTFTVKTAN